MDELAFGKLKASCDGYWLRAMGGFLLQNGFTLPQRPISKPFRELSDVLVALTYLDILCSGPKGVLPTPGGRYIFRTFQLRGGSLPQLIKRKKKKLVLYFLEHKLRFFA